MTSIKRFLKIENSKPIEMIYCLTHVNQICYSFRMDFLGGIGIQLEIIVSGMQSVPRLQDYCSCCTPEFAKHMFDCLFDDTLARCSYSLGLKYAPF